MKQPCSSSCRPSIVFIPDEAKVKANHILGSTHTSMVPKKWARNWTWTFLPRKQLRDKLGAWAYVRVAGAHSSGKRENCVFAPSVTLWIYSAVLVSLYLWIYCSSAGETCMLILPVNVAGSTRPSKWHWRHMHSHISKELVLALTCYIDLCFGD